MKSRRILHSHIHHPSDGRGPRRVFVNGNPVPNCTYADTEKGIVRCHLNPPRIKKNSSYFYERTLRGKVIVEELRP